MKKTFAVFLLISIFSMGTLVVSAQYAMADFKKLGWIAGNWKLTGGKDGVKGSEKWQPVSDTLWEGYGVNYKEGDTSSVEKLKLVLKNHKIYYIADLPGNPEPVWFKLTDISANSFTCENLEYDFPKHIEYHNKGRKLKATISGNGRFIDYEFKKK